MCDWIELKQSTSTLVEKGGGGGGVKMSEPSMITEYVALKVSKDVWINGVENYFVILTTCIIYLGFNWNVNVWLWLYPYLQVYQTLLFPRLLDLLRDEALAIDRLASVGIKVIVFKKNSNIVYSNSLSMSPGLSHS